MKFLFSTVSRESAKSFLVFAVCLLLVLLVLFARAFTPGHTVFSNDGPLGTLASESHRVSEVMTGGWQDLNTLGFREGGAWPNLTFGLLWLVGPLVFSKIYVAFSLMILGVGAWTFLRQLRLAPAACVLGGLAAALNSGFFSAAAWGVAAHPITIGMAFFAMAALVDTNSSKRWLKTVLAGVCVGMGVAEGADIGAIFSIYVAAFAMFQAWVVNRDHAKDLATGAVRVAIMAVLAVIVAAQAMTVLISTQVKGVAGGEQDAASKQQRWDWATQWSLPPQETLGFVIPGFFGYRMDTPLSLPEGMQEEYTGGNYWGAAGRDPNWYRFWKSGNQGNPPQGFMRFTGGGNYMGILVVLVAAWAVGQAFRRKDSAFGDLHRRWIFFWFAVLVISLLLAYGRFAPLYQFLYMLPYFSSIRNPAKFVHVVSWSLVILFGYGVHGLWKCYMEQFSTALAGRKGSWWHRLGDFERRWVQGLIALVGVSLLGWLIFASSRDNFIAYLQGVQIEGQMANEVARFALSRVGYYLVFLVAGVALFALTLGGVFSGSRAKVGAVLLGVFLVADLGRANLPWVIIWDYAQKYATNPVLERLRKRPNEHRVALLPFRTPPQLEMYDQLYRIEWAQHHFLYYNIHSLDIIQMSRFPSDLLAFEQALQPDGNAATMSRMARKWELTSTRYLLGATGFRDILNEQLDPGKRRFRIVQSYRMVPKPGVTNPTRLEQMTVVPDENGDFSLYEFQGALPRAGVFTSWQVSTNDTQTLARLASTDFNPHSQVLVCDAITPPNTQGETNALPADYVSYKPKHIVLKARAAAPAVVLLNDRHDVNWKVLVDGKPAPLLRCNFIMRGVQIQAGEHQVEFLFEPAVTGVYISIAGVIVGLLALGVLVVGRGRERLEKLTAKG